MQKTARITLSWFSEFKAEEHLEIAVYDKVAKRGS